MNGSRWLRSVLGGLLVVLLAVSGAAACGVPAPPPPAPGSPMGGGPGPMGGGPALDEAGYLAEMIPHHQEAVAAATQLARSPRPEMRSLGERIVTTQSAEIQQMAGWLATWYPQQPPAVYDPMMRDLSTLTGDDLDRAFLTDMIPHHMEAVMMSQRLLVTGSAVHPEVAAFAGTVRDTQRDEIVLMRGWLTSWFPGAAGPGGMGPGGMHGPGGWPR
ncbi:MAG TPA: DUF305 domain-containing protein [Jiangellales bacterium]|nr:DUF305 domain-containing protein [Jiangellales bacterium]